MVGFIWSMFLVTEMNFHQQLMETSKKNQSEEIEATKCYPLINNKETFC